MPALPRAQPELEQDDLPELRFIAAQRQGKPIEPPPDTLPIDITTFDHLQRPAWSKQFVSKGAEGVEEYAAKPVFRAPLAQFGRPELAKRSAHEPARLSRPA